MPSNKIQLWDFFAASFKDKLKNQIESSKKVVLVYPELFFEFLFKNLVKSIFSEHKFRFFLDSDCDGTWSEKEFDGLELFSEDKIYWVLQSTNQWKILKNTFVLD